MECKAKGIFRKRGLSPVAGDWVEIDENHTIASIRERKNHFIRTRERNQRAAVFPNARRRAEFSPAVAARVEMC